MKIVKRLKPGKKEKKSIQNKYQIDQSGKIEQTNKDTVVAYSNSSQHAVLIPRKLKRRIQEIFRMHGFTSLFIYYLFSVGIFYLLESLKQESDIVIDTEYPGKEKLIGQFITMLLGANQKPKHEITFARIGNRPRAHYAAKDVFDKKIKPNRILLLIDIIKALKKTDGRLRECLATLVDVQIRSYKRIIPKKYRKNKR